MNSLAIEKLPEFDNHKLVTFIFDEKTGLRGFIAIHRNGKNMPSLGATRVWNYESETDALRDALRLSKLMSYKSALAGLPYGGAKAALMLPKGGLKSRDAFFDAYAKKIDSLEGKFITGTDVGVTDDDVKEMKKSTKFVIGSKVDPAHYTAVGVFCGIQESLRHVFGTDSIADKTFAIQGVGKTGSQLLELLYPQAKKIFIADIDSKKTKELKSKYPKISVVSPDTIHRQKVDVFAPCALSGVLNTKNVAELQCKIVAGSANNQLSDPTIDNLVYKLGVLYAPDYAINAGGLISVVDELEHPTPSQARILSKVANIRLMLRDIFEKSAKAKRGTSTIANEMAEKIFNGN